MEFVIVFAIICGIISLLGFTVWCVAVEKRLRLMKEIMELMDEKIERRTK
ncbi:unnamed protein product [marine sediment metagenome]|uniref:Uncharacterized protein n=1 Tax=marine sediment metagenome TaxID=412755 RepID=X0XTR4_9ZZZZ